MNCSVLSGRLTKDPEVRYTQTQMAIADFTVASDRRFKRDGEPTADFIRCIAFGKTAEFIEKYFTKGKPIILSGRIQTGSYQNKEGQTVYTTEVVVENVEFLGSKSENERYERPASEERQEPPAGPAPDDGFMDIPEGFDEQLPFA